jgi:hypothetical protein
MEKFIIAFIYFTSGGSAQVCGTETNTANPTSMTGSFTAGSGI